MLKQYVNNALFRLGFVLLYTGIFIGLSVTGFDTETSAVAAIPLSLIVSWLLITANK